MNYSSRERRSLEALLHRASHLAERSEHRTDWGFDRAELKAIGWALAQVIAARGALPEDLDKLRTDIWPASVDA